MATYGHHEDEITSLFGLRSYITPVRQGSLAVAAACTEPEHNGKLLGGLLVEVESTERGC